MNRRSRVALFAASSLALVTLTACAGNGGDNKDDAGTPAGQVQAQRPSQQSGGVTVKVTDGTKLGSIVTDQRGLPLYRFDEDIKGKKSNCNGPCTEKWPPLLANGEVKVEGGDPALLGTITRLDGSKQVTYGGWPAYNFVKDKQQGDLNGQGVGGTWFVLAPDGKKAKAGSVSSLGDQTGGDSGGDSGGGSGSGSGGYSY